FEVRGRRLGTTDALVLYDPVGLPLRLASAVEGVFRNGESSPYAAYDRWASGSRRVRIEVAGPLTLHIRVGLLVAGPAIGRVTAEISSSGSVSVPVPPAPFRIEVRYGEGPRTSIGFTPSR